MVDVFRFILKENKILFEKIGCVGRKDRYVFIFQYIFVLREYIINFNKENVKVEFIGYLDDFVFFLIFEGNFFEIIIRKLKNKDEKVL